MKSSVKTQGIDIGNLSSTVDALNGSQDMIYRTYIDKKIVDANRSKLKMKKIIKYLNDLDLVFSDIFSKLPKTPAVNLSLKLFNDDFKKYISVLNEKVSFNKFINDYFSCIVYVKKIHIWIEKFNEGKVINQQYPEFITNNKFQFPIYLLPPFSDQGINFYINKYNKIYNEEELKELGYKISKNVNDIIVWYEYNDTDFDKTFEEISSIIFGLSKKQEINAILQHKILKGTLENILDKCYKKFIYKETIDNLYDNIIPDIIGLVNGKTEESENLSVDDLVKAAYTLQSDANVIDQLSCGEKEMKKKLNKNFEIMENLIETIDDEGDQTLINIKKIVEEKKKTATERRKRQRQNKRAKKQLLIKDLEEEKKE